MHDWANLRNSMFIAYFQLQHLICGGRVEQHSDDLLILLLLENNSFFFVESTIGLFYYQYHRGQNMRGFS